MLSGIMIDGLSRITIYLQIPRNHGRRECESKIGDSNKLAHRQKPLYVLLSSRIVMHNQYKIDNKLQREAANPFNRKCKPKNRKLSFNNPYQLFSPSRFYPDSRKTHESKTIHN